MTYSFGMQNFKSIYIEAKYLILTLQKIQLLLNKGVGHNVYMLQMNAVDIDS